MADEQRTRIQIFGAEHREDALALAEFFAAGESVAVLLGDNIFHGHGFQNILHPVCGAEP